MKTTHADPSFAAGRLWNKYKTFVERAIKPANPTNSSDNLDHWRERLFTNCILYALPVSMIALIPSVIITTLNGHIVIPAFDIFALISIILVVFNNKLNILFRKAFVVVVLYTLAILVMAVLGSFGIGSIYLLALSVFIALLFPPRAIYFSIIANVLIYAAFALIIYFKLFDSPLTHNNDSSFWIGYSCNFMFLNLVVIMQIRQVINGLEGAVAKEARLLNELQTEIEEKQQRNELLKESEEHYKSLFLLNPSPMWIFDKDTLRFLQVNDAAIRKYGYTEEEFLNMTIKDLRNADEVDELLTILQSNEHTGSDAVCTTRHRCKDGRQFYAEVRCSTIPFKGKQARLVIARNITAHIEHTQAIEKQNARLREIAYMQSHIVRAPLARVIALTDLIMQDTAQKPDSTLLTYLDTSVKELDDIVKAIISNSADSFSTVTPVEE